MCKWSVVGSSKRQSHLMWLLRIKIWHCSVNSVLRRSLIQFGTRKLLVMEEKGILYPNDEVLKHYDNAVQHCQKIRVQGRVCLNLIGSLRIFSQHYHQTRVSNIFSHANSVALGMATQVDSLSVSNEISIIGWIDIKIKINIYTNSRSSENES